MVLQWTYEFKVFVFEHVHSRTDKGIRNITEIKCSESIINQFTFFYLFIVMSMLYSTHNHWQQFIDVNNHDDKQKVTNYKVLLLFFSFMNKIQINMNANRNGGK